MAIWEKATLTGTAPGSRINIDGTGPDWVRVLSPKFRLNDGSDYAIVGFGAKVSASGVPVETLGPELAGSRQPFTSATGVTANNTTCVWDTPTVGYLNITNSIISGNTNGRITVTTEIGSQYKVVMVGKNVTSDNIRVAIFGSAVDVSSDDTPATTDTTHTIYFTADSTSTGVFMHNRSSTTSKVSAIKSISVKKVL